MLKSLRQILYALKTYDKIKFDNGIKSFSKADDKNIGCSLYLF